MKNDQFHMPFIKTLVIIAAVTLVSMGTARYFIERSLSTPQESQIFTSLKSQNLPESGERKLIGSVSH